MGQGITIDRNPQIEAAAVVLGEWMAARGYPESTLLVVRSIVGCTGCVAEAVGPGLLMAYDEASAEDIFTAALAEVPYEDPSWGHTDFPVARPGPSQAVPSQTSVPMLPPITGGDAYEPTDEEWADYRAWSEWLERTERAIESRRPWACDDDRATDRAAGEW